MGKIKYVNKYDVIRKNIEIINGCWEWIGCLDSNGYGHIPTLRFAKIYKVTRAHRYSYLVFKGYFDRKLFICHTCNNRRCVNPKHLYAGTAKDNITDMHNAGRNNNVKGSKHGRSKLTEEDVRMIRVMLNQRYTGRDIAYVFGVGEKCISKIKLGLRWGHTK